MRKLYLTFYAETNRKRLDADFDAGALFGKRNRYQQVSHR